MKKKLLFLTLTGLSLSYTPASWAWGFTGHMLVAEIAYTQLEPEVKQEVDALIKAIPDNTTQIQDFVPASTWLDTLRWGGLGTSDHWHYINQPYNPNGLPLTSTQNSDNIIWALKQAHKTLSHPKAGDFHKGYMLRALIHMVGDIHQPLHCVSRVDIHHPQGDRGGNSHLLTSPSFKNFHAYWDGMAGLYPRLSYQDWKKVAPWAQELTQSYPLKREDTLTFEPEEWAKESYQLGVTSYQKLGYSTLPNPETQKWVQETSAQRVTLAGYRLAALLNSLF